MSTDVPHLPTHPSHRVRPVDIATPLLKMVRGGLMLILRALRLGSDVQEDAETDNGEVVVEVLYSCPTAKCEAGRWSLI